MSDLDYFKGEWESFKTFERAEHFELKADIKEIKGEIYKLNDFKSRVYGIVSVIGIFTGGIGAALFNHLLKNM